MTTVTFDINDELVDAVGIQRNAAAFNGKWEVYLSHRIGSAKDQFGRPIGRYTSGKGIDLDPQRALDLAYERLAMNVSEQLAEQNARPPAPSKGIASDEADLLKLLEL